jgi:hypothetical protein
MTSPARGAGNERGGFAIDAFTTVCTAALTASGVHPYVEVALVAAVITYVL